jgi:transposase-like protein
MTTETIPQTPAIRNRSRAEALMHCPSCGHSGSLRRVGGGTNASTFECQGYTYNPRSGNVCRFRFTVNDVRLERFA